MEVPSTKQGFHYSDQDDIIRSMVWLRVRDETPDTEKYAYFVHTSTLGAASPGKKSLRKTRSTPALSLKATCGFCRSGFTFGNVQDKILLGPIQSHIADMFNGRALSFGKLPPPAMCLLTLRTRLGAIAASHPPPVQQLTRQSSRLPQPSVFRRGPGQRESGESCWQYSR